MQAVQAFDGYVEGGQFYPMGAIRLPGRFRAVLTVIMDVQPPQHEEDVSMDWVDELERIALSATSPPLRMEDFPRMDFGREPILFASDGENV